MNKNNALAMFFSLFLVIYDFYRLSGFFFILYIATQTIHTQYLLKELWGISIETMKDKTFFLP
jgi:hypothetical protein